MKSFRVVTIQIKSVPVSHDRVRIEAARLWNRMVLLHRFFRKRHLPWPTEAQFKAHFKRRFALHSQTVQGLIEKFFENIATARTARKNGDKVARYPHRLKSYVVPVWKPQGIQRNGKRLELSMGKGRKPLRIKIPALPAGDITEVELGRGECYVTLQSPEISIPAQAAGIAAIDLGIIHTAVVTDGIGTLALVGRGLRAAVQGHNKAKAQIASLRTKCVKGSRRYRKLGYALFRRAKKRDNIQRNVLHHTSNKIVEFAVTRAVGTVYVGDITEMNRGKKRKRSKRLNQEVGNAPFAQLIGYLGYKLAKHGAEMKKASEAYTSQTCPECLDRYKPSGRIYSCRACGFTAPRDQVGSWNFLNKCVNGTIIPGALVPRDQPKYLRPVAMHKPRIRSVVAPLAAGLPQGMLLPMTRVADDVAVGANQPYEVLGTARSAA